MTLGAYAELRGSLSFIGIVEVSGKVTVALEYDVNAKLLRGCAAVTAEVSSIFGKKDVTRDVEVEVPLGDGGAVASPALAWRHAAPAAGPDAAEPDLSFGDHFTKPQWTTYCAAFAA